MSQTEKNNLDLYFASFHLPGKHNQKLHGLRIGEKFDPKTFKGLSNSEKASALARHYAKVINNPERAKILSKKTPEARIKEAGNLAAKKASERYQITESISRPGTYDLVDREGKAMVIAGSGKTLFDSLTKEQAVKKQTSKIKAARTRAENEQRGYEQSLQDEAENFDLYYSADG
jgi:hypothetical protein